MTGPVLALVMFGVLLVFIGLRMPIAIALFMVGAIGMACLTSFEQLLIWLEAAPVGRTASYSLSVIPIFLLMGHLAMHCGLSAVLYKSARAWFGHRPGGIAVATIGGCAGFGAVCGSSLATAATMGRVALPEMLKRGYAPTLATGSIAAGGTLGMLIPPSVIMVIYAFLAEQFVITLFIAALIPGLIAILFHFIAIGVVVRINPEAGPAGERMSWPERFVVLRESWGVLLLLLLVIGGIYGGVFTVAEAASLGAGLAFIFTVGRGKLTVGSFWLVLKETAFSRKVSNPQQELETT